MSSSASTNVASSPWIALPVIVPAHECTVMVVTAARGYAHRNANESIRRKMTFHVAVAQPNTRSRTQTGRQAQTRRRMRRPHDDPGCSGASNLCKPDMGGGCKGLPTTHHLTKLEDPRRKAADWRFGTAQLNSASNAKQRNVPQRNATQTGTCHHASPWSFDCISSFFNTQ